MLAIFWCFFEFKAFRIRTINNYNRIDIFHNNFLQTGKDIPAVARTIVSVVGKIFLLYYTV